MNTPSSATTREGHASGERRLSERHLPPNEPRRFDGDEAGGDFDTHELLSALQAMRVGDFTVRLPADRTGGAARVADAFNAIASANARMAQQLEQVVQAVGRDAQTKMRVRLGLSDGAWGEIEQSLNTLIDDLPATAMSRSSSAAAELEARIEQRTREREQALARLFEARKIDTIGQLTGGVAHDFNNLLMAMIGSLEVLKKRLPADDSARFLLDNAMKGAERGAALTQRLLAFARRQELRPEAIDLRDLVGGVRELLHRALGPRITLIEDLACDLPPVLADADQLELALMNLALNARDAMPEGGALRIATSAEIVADGGCADLAPGRYVRLSVTDTGQGMDAATFARAAEPFFTTKGAGKGAGLGLPVVQGLAVQSGGALRIESRPGRGTSAHLLLPAANAVRATAVCSGVEVAAPERSAADDGAATILLVDDDALVSIGTAAMLEDLGHRVILADSAAAALDLLEAAGEIDLIITDHAMPKMTGLEFARIARQRCPDLPIVLATGYADLDLSAGRDLDCPRLAKPFLQRDLARVVAQLRRPQAARPLAVGE